MFVQLLNYVVKWYIGAFIISISVNVWSLSLPLLQNHDLCYLPLGLFIAKMYATGLEKYVLRLQKAPCSETVIMLQGPKKNFYTLHSIWLTISTMLMQYQ